MDIDEPMDVDEGDNRGPNAGAIMERFDATDDVLAIPNSVWSAIIPQGFLLGSSSATRLKSGTNLTRQLRVFSIAMLPTPRPDLENGGKMILPPSILQAITQKTVQLRGPMLFRVTNDGTTKSTHCGVLEFIAEEGRCYMPYWRMHNIGANEGDLVTVEVTAASIGKFALFEPQSIDFLDITDPTALLENSLRNFSCITKGEMLVIRYNNRIYQLKVLETKPTDVINITECDIDVDFAPVVGQPQESPAEVDEQLETANPEKFVAFVGAGQRINGKEVPQTTSGIVRKIVPRGQPDFDWKPGTLTFNRQFRQPATATNPNCPNATANDSSSKKEEQKSFTPFQGAGVTLKGPQNAEED